MLVKVLKGMRSEQGRRNIRFAVSMRQERRFKQLTRFAPITLLILSSFFMRGVHPEELGVRILSTISSSYLSVVAAVIISLSLFSRLLVKGKVPNIQCWPIYYLLVFFILLSLFWNILFISPEKTLRFTVELLFCIGLVFIIYLYIRDLNAVSIVYRIIMVIGGITALYTLIVFLPLQEQVSRIYRVSQSAAYLRIGGQNHAAHALAIAAMISLVAFYCDRKKVSKIFDLIILALLLPTVFLTGSRDASLGLAVSISIFLLLIPKIRILKIAIIVLCLLILPLAYLGIHRISSNLNRYDLDFMASSIESRQHLISNATEQSLKSAGTILFGAGMYRYNAFGEIDYSTTTLYPHNVFISMLVFVGLPAMLLFLTRYFVLFKKLGHLILAVRDNTDISSKFVINCTFFSLVIASMYALSNGRLTRTLTIWIIMGLAERVIDTYKQTLPKSVKHFSMTR